jgi:hypothetical protein
VAIVGRELSIVDAARGAVLRTVGGVAGASVAVSPDMSRAAVANGTAFVRSFAGTGRFPLGSPAPPVTALAWDGTTLSIAGAVSASWDLASPPARGRGNVPVVPDDLIARATGGRVARKELRGAAVTVDGGQLVTLAVSRTSSVARPEAELAVWPAAGGPARVSKRMSVEDGALAVSKTGLVAVGGREITFYRLASLQKQRALPRAEAPATALAFTPDGRLLASGHMDGTIAFWEVASGRRRGILVVGEDGRWVYAAEDGRVDGDGAFVSLSVAGVVTPPGITRAHVPSLSPLSNRR